MFPAVNIQAILFGTATLSLAWACGGSSDLATGSLPATSRSMPSVTVLRVPREGGLARLYRVPSLDSAAWKLAERLPPVDRPIGADAEQGLVFVLDRKNNVVAVDLDTRRVRTFRSKLQGKPAELYGTTDGALIAHLAGNQPALEYLGSDQAPTSRAVPEGQLTTTFLGDLVAVAADTAVVLYPPESKSEHRSIPIAGDARAVLFSPSGHRLYVARAAAPLLVLDRFEGTRLREVELPGPARSLRGDIYGNWLLVRPENGDSVWVIDVGTGKYLGATASRWSEDLPAVAPPHTLLVRRGNDLVALDLASTGFTQTGRVEGGAGDYWLPLAWHPANETEIPIESDSSALASSDTGPGRPNVYLQVSSSQNPTWASELSEKLRAAGLPASVLTPKRSEDAYRVVLGPYATREQAEQTSRTLGMPSFIVTAQDQSAQ
jgi:hypothetical protein